MNVELFAAFCVAAALLIVMPGPIVSLVIANSQGHGTRIGLATVAGTSVGNAMLVGAAAAGRARTWFADPRRQRLQARITGSPLITTGIGLLPVRRA